MTSPGSAAAAAAEAGRLAEWQKFCDTCYGRPCGVLHEGIPYLLHRFPESDEIRVLVRDVYPDIYRWIVDRAACIEGEKKAHRLIAFGSPGIGKSTFLVYLVTRCLEEKRTVVYHKTGLDFAVVFKDGAVEIVAPQLFKYLPGLRSDQPAIIAIDSVDLGVPLAHLLHITNAVTVVAASPRTARHRPFAKSAGETFYWTLSPPGPAELKNVMTLRGLGKDPRNSSGPLRLSEMLPGSVYNSCTVTGGPPYSIADLPTSHAKHERIEVSTRSTQNVTTTGSISDGTVRNIDEDNSPPDGYKDLVLGARTFRVRDTATYDLDELVMLVPPSFRQQLVSTLRKSDDIHGDLFSDVPIRHLNKSVLLVAMDPDDSSTNESAQISGYHCLFSILPHENSTQPNSMMERCVVVIASPVVQEMIRVAVSNMETQDQLQLARMYLHEPTMQGILYETATIRLLGWKGDHQVEIVRSGMVTGETIVIPKDMTHSAWSPDKDPLPTKAGVYILPPRFPSADAVVVLGASCDTVILVQATISDEHPIKKDGMERISRRIPLNPRPRLVYAFLGPDRGTVKNLACTQRPTLTVTLVRAGEAESRESPESLATSAERAKRAALEVVFTFERSFIHKTLANADF
ncbi:hypothetical protein Rhopal_002883-T1 [Rhodotorula paludigena]|uniref:Uncharacterized protein n=1 Tax=Rhodotorula paludigena TaxID=86838 RepID=A0AAV5GJ10_9BASI|nr:hypothetical protein Rhopal_002883-T1 [Rhodotorula paludigena]